MNLPSVTIKQLLEAGVHLGHKTFRWNPKMKKYIFGSKDSIHIIDLTSFLLKKNLKTIYTNDKYGGHLSKYGNKIVSKIIFSEIKNKHIRTL